MQSTVFIETCLHKFSLKRNVLIRNFRFDI